MDTVCELTKVNNEIIIGAKKALFPSSAKTIFGSIVAEIKAVFISGDNILFVLKPFKEFDFWWVLVNRLELLRKLEVYTMQINTTINDNALILWIDLK